MCVSCAAVSAVLVGFMFLVFFLLFVLSVSRVFAAPFLGFTFATAAAVTPGLLPVPLPLLLHFLLLIRDKHTIGEPFYAARKELAT